MRATKEDGQAHPRTPDDPMPTCGIIMPISATDDCSETHWSEVRNIIFDVVSSAGLRPNMVSDADDVGIIQKRIIQNLYDNPIVVCDVSGKNPNVMFELGLRLAFDKPAIIIKDDRTAYSFDTAPIEHLEYPRDLRFTKIMEFKKVLAEKLSATLKASTENQGYTTFLKHFGEFKIARLEQREVSPQEYLMSEIDDLKKSIRRIESRLLGPGILSRVRRPSASLRLENLTWEQAGEVLDYARNHPVVEGARLARSHDDDCPVLFVHIRPDYEDRLDILREELASAATAVGPSSRPSTAS